jgi:hypothetical protein
MANDLLYEGRLFPGANEHLRSVDRCFAFTDEWRLYVLQ